MTVFHGILLGVLPKVVEDERIFAPVDDTVLIQVQLLHQLGEDVVAGVQVLDGLDQVGELVYGLLLDGIEVAVRGVLEPHEDEGEDETTDDDVGEDNESPGKRETVVNNVVDCAGTVHIAREWASLLRTLVLGVVGVFVEPADELVSGVAEGETADDRHTSCDHAKNKELQSLGIVDGHATRSLVLDSHLAFLHLVPHECAGNDCSDGQSETPQVIEDDGDDLVEAEETSDGAVVSVLVCIASEVHASLNCLDGHEGS